MEYVRQAKELMQGPQDEQQEGGFGGLVKSFGGHHEAQAAQPGGFAGLSHMLGAAEEAGAGDEDATADDDNLFQSFAGRFMKKTGSNNPAGVGDSNDVNKLLGRFEQQTGNTFSGTGPEWDVLAKIASQVTGNDVNPWVLQKIVKWKMGNMF